MCIGVLFVSALAIRKVVCREGDIVVAMLPNGPNAIIIAVPAKIDRIYDNTMVLHLYEKDIFGDSLLCAPKTDERCYMHVSYSRGIVELHSSLCIRPTPPTPAPSPPVREFITTTPTPKEVTEKTRVDFLWWIVLAICVLVILLVTFVRRPHNVAVSGRWSAEELKFRDSTAFHIPKGPRDSRFMKDSMYWSVMRNTASRMWMKSFGRVITPDSKYVANVRPRQPRPVTPKLVHVRQHPISQQISDVTTNVQPALSYRQAPNAASLGRLRDPEPRQTDTRPQHLELRPSERANDASFQTLRLNTRALPERSRQLENVSRPREGRHVQRQGREHYGSREYQMRGNRAWAPGAGANVYAVNHGLH